MGIAFECRLRLEYMVVQQLQLAGDEVGVGGIPAPGGDVNGVQAAVDGGAYRGKLGDDERGGMRRRRDGEVAGQGASWRGKAGEAELDVLQRSVDETG